MSTGLFIPDALLPFIASRRLVSVSVYVTGLDAIEAAMNGLLAHAVAEAILNRPGAALVRLHHSNIRAGCVALLTAPAMANHVPGQSVLLRMPWDSSPESAAMVGTVDSLTRAAAYAAAVEAAA